MFSTMARWDASSPSSAHPLESTTEVTQRNLPRADKERREKMKKESHLVTLNEVRFSLQEGESFSYTHHKRWKIIMHIKGERAGAGVEGKDDEER